MSLIAASVQKVSKVTATTDFPRDEEESSTAKMIFTWSSPRLTADYV